MGTGICFAGNWDFHVFYHWKKDFLNITGNGKFFLKIATGIARYFVNGKGFRNKRWENGIWIPPPPLHTLQDPHTMLVCFCFYNFACMCVCGTFLAIKHHC